MPGAINLDSSPEVGADVVHDLTVRPWPFAADTFDAAYAFDVVEHLPDVVRTMEEIHRVCRDGARVHITVPHFSSGNAFTDPTHLHQFGCFTFDYFTGEHGLAYYSRARFRRAATQLVFHPTLVNKLVHRLANRWPERYERRWAWIFPAWFLSVELAVEK